MNQGWIDAQCQKPKAGEQVIIKVQKNVMVATWDPASRLWAALSLLTFSEGDVKQWQPFIAENQHSTGNGAPPPPTLSNNMI